MGSWACPFHQQLIIVLCFPQSICKRVWYMTQVNSDTLQISIRAWSPAPCSMLKNQDIMLNFNSSSKHKTSPIPVLVLQVTYEYCQTNNDTISNWLSCTCNAKAFWWINTPQFVTNSYNDDKKVIANVYRLKKMK